MLEQLLVWLKAPVTETPETVAAVVPELVIVTVCAAEVEPDDRAREGQAGRGGVEHRSGRGAGAGQAHRVGDPARVDGQGAGPGPVAVGENVTLTVHEPFAAIDEPQVLVWRTSPLAEIEETAAAEPVGLETVTVCAALVVPVALRAEVQRARAGLHAGGGYGG